MSDATPRSHAPIHALVTGGGGFLGRAIIERLIARGDRVRSIARNRYPELDAMGVETIKGDITDSDLVERACQGIDTVFHVAAKAGVWGSYDSYHKPNVVGTQITLEASRKAGVRRFVHTSSPSVVFDGRDMEGVSESAPHPSKFRSHYSATKARAEQLVLAANAPDFKTIALRPHLVWGPRDNHIVPRIVSQARAGRLRIIGDGLNKVDTTYIDNAADAHMAAADALDSNPNAAGRAYFISNGEPIAIREIVNGIVRAAGLPPIAKHVPRSLAVAIGGAFELVYKVLQIRNEPRLTRFVAEELSSSHWFDISAARQELGYAPKVTIAEGLERLAFWFAERDRLVSR